MEAAEKCDVIAIDEVGPMELLSQKFKKAVMHALQSGKLVLAVVHAKAQDQLINEVKQREDAEVFTVTSANRDSLPEELLKRAIETL